MHACMRTCVRTTWIIYLIKKVTWERTRRTWHGTRPAGWPLIDEINKAKMSSSFHRFVWFLYPNPSEAVRLCERFPYYVPTPWRTLARAPCLLPNHNCTRTGAMLGRAWLYWSHEHIWTRDVTPKEKATWNPTSYPKTCCTLVYTPSVTNYKLF
jgi:hypothetical protein